MSIDTTQTLSPTSGPAGAIIISMVMIPLSFLLLVRKVIGQVVTDKESGMKEYLHINGCSSTAYHLSTMCSEAIIAFIVKKFSL